MPLLRTATPMAIAASLATLLLNGCAPAAYSPRPLDAEPLSSHSARSPSDSGFTALVEASGYQGTWPPERWNLETLTLTALYFNPQMATVRAQAAVADAQIATAAQGLPLGMQIAAQHHSRQLGGDSPWTLGLSLDLPLTGSSRRDARIDRATALAEAARLDVAATAWRVRSSVRDALIEYFDASRQVGALAQRLGAQREMAALVRSRVDAGMLSARELGLELTAVAELETHLESQKMRSQQALSALAGALGLPLQTVQRFNIADDALEVQPAVPAPDDVREIALKNRLDVQRQLLEFGAADADVRLAVASQYPELSLSPGYLWDQGDRIWSLATALVFPAGARGLAGVREAEARRELAAQHFSALQFNVILQTEQALAAWSSTAAFAGSAARQADIAQQQRARIQRLFDAGAAGRLELVSAQLVSLSARQALNDAATERARATARLEDTMQKPLMGMYRRLPDSAQARSGELK